MSGNLKFVNKCTNNNSTVKVITFCFLIMFIINSINNDNKLIKTKFMPIFMFDLDYINLIKLII